MWLAALLSLMLELIYEKVFKLAKQKLPLTAPGMETPMLGWSTLKAANL